MTLEDFDRTILDIPKTKTEEAISAYSSINLDHLRDVAERFRKIPTYEEVLNKNIRLNKERQELIDYLQEQIKRCEKNIEIHSKEISKLVDVKNHNRHVILRVRIKMAKQVYEEILSKIEKR